MSKCYIELRQCSARGSDSLAADIMRHLHARLHLGKAIIITKDPLSTLAAARKQWLKLGRIVQRQRAQTLNADKILKFTHNIARMQNLQFTTKNPLQMPNADIHFLHPDDIAVAPVQCWTIYILTEPSEDAVAALIPQLPAEALIADYQQTMPWEEKFSLQPKAVLEAQVASEWQQVQQFLTANNIDITSLMDTEILDVEAMDNALDTLLGMSRKFLQVANEFQRSLELARPLRISKSMRAKQDSLMLLAHRVQALSPGVFTQQFLETYNEDDTFFLNDVLRGYTAGLQGGIAEAFNNHMAAGRTNLAKALLEVSGDNTSAYKTRPLNFAV